MTNKNSPILHADKWQASKPPSCDLVITDPPYGVTGYDWDREIDAHKFMAEMLRLTGGKPVVVFGCQPFTSLLVCAAKKHFKYELIWEKSKATGHLQAKHRPMRAHENILVFYSQKVYNPQMTAGKPYKGTPRGTSAHDGIYQAYGAHRSDNKGTRYPRSVLRYGARQRSRIHGTQKPVALLRFLVASYSDPGDLVFDPFAGSGSTLVSAFLEGRRAIGCEVDAVQASKSQEWLGAVAGGKEPGV